MSRVKSDPALIRRIGDRLRQARQARGYSLTQLAECLGVSFQQLGKYERGLDRISADTLFHCAILLERDIAWFFAVDPPAPVRRAAAADHAIAAHA